RPQVEGLAAREALVSAFHRRLGVLLTLRADGAPNGRVEEGRGDLVAAEIFVRAPEVGPEDPLDAPPEEGRRPASPLFPVGGRGVPRGRLRPREVALGLPVRARQVDGAPRGLESSRALPA